MKTMKRWQAMLPMMVGGLLLMTPLAYGLATMSVTDLRAWILGAVVGVGAVTLAYFWLAGPHVRGIEGITMLFGLILLVSPWMLGEALLSASALISVIIGLALIGTAGTVLLENRSRQTYQTAYREALAYRRVSEPL